MPRRYKQGADGQPHPAFYGKLPEEFSKADTMRFIFELLIILDSCVSNFLSFYCLFGVERHYIDVCSLFAACQKLKLHFRSASSTFYIT